MRIYATAERQAFYNATHAKSQAQSKISLKTGRLDRGDECQSRPLPDCVSYLIIGITSRHCSNSQLAIGVLAVLSKWTLTLIR